MTQHRESNLGPSPLEVDALQTEQSKRSKALNDLSHSVGLNMVTDSYQILHIKIQPALSVTWPLILFSSAATTKHCEFLLFPSEMTDL